MVKLSVKPLNFAAKKTVVLKGQFRRHHPHGCSTRRQGAYVEILCEPFASRHFLPLRCWFACLLMFGKHDKIFSSINCRETDVAVVDWAQFAGISKEFDLP